MLMRPESPRDTGSQTLKVARYFVSKRVDGKAVGEKKGPPGLERSSGRSNPLALDPACTPLLLGNTAGSAEQHVAPQRGEVKGTGRAPEIVSEDTMEVAGPQPMSSDSRNGVFGSPLV